MTTTKRASVCLRLATTLLLATAAALPGTVQAQSAEANLRGTAPARATVTVKNLATGLVRHTTAADDGSYMIVGLPSGTYDVDAGPHTQTKVTLTVASTTTLALGAALDDITVTSQRDLGPGAPEMRTPEVAFVVFGLPDEKKGERLVVLHKISEAALPALLEKFAACDLPNLWKPKVDAFYRVESFPMLGTGKLDIRTVKEMAAKLAG